MFGKKQLDFLKNSTHSFNFCCGSVSSGKTYINNLRWYQYINEAPERSLLVMSGKTLESVNDNCVRGIMDVDQGIGDLKPSWIRPGVATRIVNRRNGVEINVCGADNQQSWSRVQGKTIAGWYADEINHHPKNLVQVLQKGCRYQGKSWPKFWTSNPDIPSHFIRTEYMLNSDIDIMTWNFLLEDNPSLSKEYIDELKRTYTGVNYNRFILGEWVSSSDYTVYRWDRSKNLVDEVEFYKGAETWCCWDFGIADPTFLIVFQIIPVPPSASNPHGMEIRIIDEYCNSNKDSKHYGEWICSRPYYSKVDIRHACDPSGSARSQSLTSWVSELERQFNFKMNYRHGYSVVDHISNANKYICSVRASEMQTPETVEMFENWAYPLDKDGKLKVGSLPNHDKYSHSGTAFYYGIINRFLPKKKGGDFSLR